MKRTKPVPLVPTGGLFEHYLDEPRCVIKLHRATRLHFDLRFEHEGRAVSFVLPTGPSLDPCISCEAIRVEDHRVSGFTFEGVFPEKMYGAGPVLVWDIGTYRNVTKQDGQHVEFGKALEMGRVEINLSCRRLRGGFILIRHGDSESSKWIMRKQPDHHAATPCDLAQRQRRSVLTDKTLDDILTRMSNTGRKAVDSSQCALDIGSQLQTSEAKEIWWRPIHSNAPTVIGALRAEFPVLPAALREEFISLERASDEDFTDFEHFSYEFE